jgi:hypothetical protein
MKFKEAVRTGIILFIILNSFTIGSCGPKMLPPHDKISDAEKAVERARGEGAGDYDPADLKIAEYKLANAKKAMSDGDYKTAARQAEESVIDAQTAEARSKAAKAKELSQKMQENVDSLRKEVERFQ